jgi:[ribosomal protein S5]-alanine N-acetyltransferase
MKPPLTFETQRLSSRQPFAEYAALTFKQYAQNPKVAKYTGWQSDQSIPA